MRRAVGALLGAAALALPPVALAHGGGQLEGYVSRVLALTPPVEGVEARIVRGDELELRVRGDATVTVAGYDGEPYLRVSAAGVDVNMRSPATHLNADPYGQATVPADASADAPPRWERLSDEPVAHWHDHRAHWMTPEDAPAVEANPDRSHHIFDWNVPLSVDGRSVAIRGTLDYVPPAGDDAARWSIAAPAVAGFAGVAALALIARRRRAAPA